MSAYTPAFDETAGVLTQSLTEPLDSINSYSYFMSTAEEQAQYFMSTIQK